MADDLRPQDLSDYATAADLGALATEVDGKVTKAGDTDLGSMRHGDDSQGIPASVYDVYICIAGVSYASGQCGGLILQGYGGGNEVIGEVIFAGGSTMYGRVVGYINSAGGGGTGYQRFYVRTAGTEVLGMELVGAGKLNLGDTTSAAAADLQVRSYSFSGVTYPLTLENRGNSTTAGGVGLYFETTTSNGTSVNSGSQRVEKTFANTTTVTTNWVLAVCNVSASLSDTVKAWGPGGLSERFRSSSSDPTTTDIPSGWSMWWYNSTATELRYWINIGGTLKKSDPFTLTNA